MNSDARRKIEMGARALAFSQAHPDTEAGTIAAAARLEQLMARATETAGTQRDGVIQQRAASARKEKLRREMREGPIAHLAEVGRAAAREMPELGESFRFRPEASNYLAFRTAARSMATAALEHRELLAKYGLAQSVLNQFVEMLDEFDELMVLGHQGRAAHVGATRDLRSLRQEIVQAVRVMDGRNRQRFAQDQQLLGSWISASTVLGRPRPSEQPEGGPPAGGEVRPAA
jgi:hypothetical protein